MKRIKRTIALLLIACLCLSLFACKEDEPKKQEPTATNGATGEATSGPDAGTTPGSEPTVPQAEEKTYTIRLISEGGAPFVGVGIYVYEDATQNELVWFARTDDTGAISFKAKVQEGYVAILEDAPEGYELQEFYTLTGEETEIVFQAEMAGAEDYVGKKFALGDVMWDLTVMDLNGQTHQLSKLLEEKDAVMLNFWYLDCAPCRMEFPYLQEAYEKDNGKIALIALNCIDSDAVAITKYFQEAGLTFPVAQCDQAMANALGIAGYPTTVVIDRFGIISLMHQGGIEGAGAFGDVMDYFTAEDYQQGVIRDVNTIITPEDNNDEPPINNPTSVGGVTSFQLTVRPGDTVYCDIYRADQMWLQTVSNSCELDYNGRTYTPSNGVVGTVLSCKDTRTPTTIALRNTGDETTTYTLTLSALAGSLNNPYTMKVGEFDVSIGAGKEEGVYYRYTAPADGYLVVQCMSASQGVPYGYTLYNLSSYANRTLDSDSVFDDDGNVVLRIACRKGEQVQFNPSALPDDNGSYPSVRMHFKASFQEGLGQEEEKVEKIVYAVTVVDKNLKGIPGVTVTIQTASGTENLTTNDQGQAAVKLEPGEYKASIRVPKGYTARITQLKLTEAAPIQSLRMDEEEKIVMNTYTVTVTDDQGKALSGVLVTVGSSFGNTDETGKVSFTLEQGSYTAVIGLPQGYTSPSISFPFQDKTDLTVVLKEQKEEEKPTVETAEYSVTVTDYYGKPLTGVTVTFYREGNVVGLQKADQTGTATVKLEKGSYTAALAFDAGSYLYDESLLVLTEAASAVTLSAIAKLGQETMELYVSDNAHLIYEGATYITGMQADVVNYFVYRPTQSGHYQVTTTDPKAVVSYWGASVNYIADQTGAVSIGNNALSLEVREEYLNQDTMYILGITGSQSATLLLERTGDIILTDEEKAEWIEYKAKEPAEEFDLTLAPGEKLTYLDLTAKSLVYVKGSDGYYHLNDENGPILYVNLGTDGRLLSYHSMLGFEQAGGTGFQHVFYEGEQFIKKEDYTICMQSFVKACVDKQGYGVYPLNDDLIYMIQNGGQSKGWYDSEDPGYLFSTMTGVNPDILWMFSVMYITN